MVCGQGDISQLRETGEVTEDLVLRDPYLLDYLGLRDSYSERDLESAILAELQQFITELGNDFAFLDRQKRITIDGEDYYIDLLFFHRRLRRLVAIELKSRGLASGWSKRSFPKNPNRPICIAFVSRAA